jgi:uncharacterized protein (DUF2141 family)
MSHRSKMQRAIPAIIATVLAGDAFAATLRVEVFVPGTISNTGRIGCALYSSEDGFPMDATKARAQLWQPSAAKVTGEFEELPAGNYAASLSHDLNNSQVVDTNWLGMPKEAWCFSRNARPSLRAPRFEEASVPVPADGKVVLSVEVGE